MEPDQHTNAEKVDTNKKDDEGSQENHIVADESDNVNSEKVIISEETKVDEKEEEIKIENTNDNEVKKEEKEDTKALVVHSVKEENDKPVDKSEEIRTSNECDNVKKEEKDEELQISGDLHSTTLKIEKSETEDKSNNNDDLKNKTKDIEENDSAIVSNEAVVGALPSNLDKEMNVKHELTEIEDEKSQKACYKSDDAVDEGGEEGKSSNPSLPSFPGTVMKTVAGSNDVKLEIAGSSLFERVILNSLKNKVVDNSRLDAAKHKYLMNNGNANTSFNSNSNGSDSNSSSSSRSVDKMIEEFKGSCKNNANNNNNVCCSSSSSSAMKVTLKEQKSDSKQEDLLNGADSDSLTIKNSSEQISEGCKDIINDDITNEQQQQQNEALDFRDDKSVDIAMLDLSVKRDEKSVPPIKRSHALYVGLPDFSKQIFTAPSITRTTNTHTQAQVPNSSTIPKVRNPDFSSATRATPELQMRHPDFSKGFSTSSSSSSSSQQAPINPSNFNEIIKKNNYISDLQLKPPPPSIATNNSQPSAAPLTSYKIDYRPPSQSSAYPNLKKESIYNYNNQQLIDEPMPHVISKSQYNSIGPKELQTYNEREMHRGVLLGGYEQVIDRKIATPSSDPHNTQSNSNEDLRKIHPAHYPHSSSQRDNEFSLKQKEQQLRQEGTIITIKNEAPVRNLTNEATERRSADLFRDYKLKQPKESPDTAAARRTVDPPPLAYHQEYPDFPTNYYPRVNKPENVNLKINSVSTVTPIHTQEYSSSMRTLHTPSPSHYRQPKSPQTIPPPGHSLMNPPAQNWISPPPLIISNRHSISPATSQQSHSSTPPNYYPPSQQPHATSTPKHSRSPSESPIPHFVHPNAYLQSASQQKIHHYRYPEGIPAPPQQQQQQNRQNSNYYHQKHPDFTRRFESERNHGFVDPHRPLQQESLQRLPVRQDLEIRTIRQPESMQYRPIEPSAYQSQSHDASRNNSQHRILHETPRHSEDMLNDRSRIPPDLKIERRTEDVKAFQIPIRRQPPAAEVVPELSIIPKVKTEPPPVATATTTSPLNPLPSTSNVIKSTKSLFGEVKRESPLDLSVKTVKTKADSTGSEQDFQSRHHHASEAIGSSSLKIEFSPNFSNVSKTDCRQQARLGPQEHYGERTLNVGANPIRYAQKESQSHLQMIPSSNKNQHYPTSQKYLTSGEMSRPHAPIPSTPDYYNKQQQQPVSNRPHQPGPSSSLTSSTSSRFDSNYHNEIGRQPYSLAQPPQQPPSQNSHYPVINKPSHAAAKPQLPSNPKDPIYLEKERDRKYVENILYGRNRQQSQFPHPELHRPYTHQITSPPRKRHLEATQHMYNSIPPNKQSRVDEISKPFGDSRFSDPQQKIIAPQSVRNDHFSHESVSSNKSINVTKHYPDPRKDAIKSAEYHASINNNNNNNLNANSNAGYYPNPKAEMINRSSDPNTMNKFYYKEVQQPSDRIPYHQNFQQRPDDGIFPTNSRVVFHPYTQSENNVIKVEQQQTTGPMSELQLLSGDKPTAAVFNGALLQSPSLSGSNGNIARGAEQSTIQKLKSNLEFKEQQKLKIQHDTHNINNNEQKKDLSPRQFRTKAEMKGYIPLPKTFDMNRVNIDSPTSSNKILPPPPPPHHHHLIPPSNSTATSAFDLLDFGSACNDFVQQLQTVGGIGSIKKKTMLKKKRLLKSVDEKSPSMSVPGLKCSADLSQVPKEILNSINKVENKSSSSDEDKPLQELKRHISQQDVNDKFSRNFREKQRKEVEQKFAARLGRPSSSESETDTRKVVRGGVKRVRRLRKREALGIKKTDDEVSETLETDYGVSAKRRSSKSLSKLDDLTSSEDDVGDDKKNNNGCSKKSDESKKKVSQQTEKVAHNKKSSSVTSSKKQISSDSSDSTSSSSSEEESMQDKINKLSSSKNAKRLKDLGDKSNIKNLLEEEETMTRSKRKLENEKKLSNSKVLRNDKVVQNVSPRDKKAQAANSTTNNNNNANNKSKSSSLKRKDSKADESKRKVHESDNEKDDGNKLKTNSSNNNKKLRKAEEEEEENSQSAESEVEEEIRTERLRPRKPKIDAEPSTKAVTRKKVVEGESVPSTSDSMKQGQRSLTDLFAHREDKTSNFKPGWEMEAYNFKRSLKIPPGLITIGRPPQHGFSHSLPDLDPQTSDTSEIFSEFVKSKDKEGNSSKTSQQQQRKSKSATAAMKKDGEEEKSKKNKATNSIIDLLHNRAMQSKKKLQTKKKAQANTSNTTTNNNNKNSANDNDLLLPTPEKESEKIFGVKKNIFETFILTSRTRTENNSFRKKEMLKEVFGADEERPRSAPPSAKLDEAEVPDIDDKKISYDQKFREYLEKMNVDFLDSKKKPSNMANNKCDISVKDEDDDFDDNETIAASEKDSITPTLNKSGKAKKNRPRRCKGSSGFDYIRKKKKPTANSSENPSSVNNIIKKRLAAMESLETKDENDICKEIKGWVRNKSVGESILHKASRLNYVDVVAYCLDRLGMDPNIKDNAGYAPLHEACSRGHVEIARLLLQFGANHSETALSGIRPLHEAIENGHIEIVRLLLSYGADPCLATYSGQLPISLAEDKEMEDFLTAYLIDINHKDGIKNSWHFEDSFKVEDPDDIGYDVFDDVPINKAELGSSVASVFSTSMTSLITATTQMSDNETVISETTATSTPMKAPPLNQDLNKYQHKMKKCDTNSNNLVISDVNNTSPINVVNENKSSGGGKRTTKNCSVILNNIDSTMKKIKKLPAIVKTESPMIIKSPTTEVIQKLNDIKDKEDYDDMMLADETLESDSEFFEVEESEAPLPPLYLLKDEGSDKWMLLTDLCNLLKVKSKEAVLKQICPSSPPSQNKDLIRELKMSEFLERATCLQLFCAGEKLNARASKVSLVRYNESVKNLLGVQTFKLGMSM